ncbi:hypothetical protein [Microcoleus sp. CAWBG58]|uniref:hypothetical protein n=1 Tax=Microcoleus sp. CAWBG58 TaxID=2841651 RepID=UPI0026002006|nr:hypothetical protein [Microcoleus sp. CAWBG58]
MGVRYSPINRKNWLKAGTLIGRNKNQTIHYFNPLSLFLYFFLNCQLSTVNCQLINAVKS